MFDRFVCFGIHRVEIEIISDILNGGENWIENDGSSGL